MTKQDSWTVVSIEKVYNYVIFDEPVTAEEAAKLFIDQEYSDIANTGSLEILEVESVK